MFVYGSVCLYMVCMFVYGVYVCIWVLGACESYRSEVLVKESYWEARVVQGSKPIERHGNKEM